MKAQDSIFYLKALFDISAWVAEVAMKPDMDPDTLSALNAEIRRLSALLKLSEAA